MRGCPSSSCPACPRLPLPDEVRGTSGTFLQEAAERRDPGRKSLWGLGGFGENIANNALPFLANAIYQVGCGINPVVLGWVLASFRTVDALIDPFVGNWSDNIHTRWGRRRPFVVSEAILLAITFAFLGLPPPGPARKHRERSKCLGSASPQVSDDLIGSCPIRSESPCQPPVPAGKSSGHKPWAACTSSLRNFVESKLGPPWWNGRHHRLKIC